jgi:hypothetical protein
MDKIAHHEGEDAEVDEEGEQEHTHGANNMVQKRYLLPRVEEHLVEASKVHCTDKGHRLHGAHVDALASADRRNKGAVNASFKFRTHQQAGMRRLARQWS